MDNHWMLSEESGKCEWKLGDYEAAVLKEALELNKLVYFKAVRKTGPARWVYCKPEQYYLDIQRRVNAKVKEKRAQS